MEQSRSQALLAGQNQALHLAMSGAALEDVLACLARTAEAESDGGILASVLLMDEDGLHLRHGAAPSLPPAYNAAIDGVAIGPRVGSCGTAAYTNRVTVVTEIATDPLWADFRDLAVAHGLRACWSTPLHATDGSVLGTFALYYREARGPTPQDRQVVQLLSNTAALVIERDLEARERSRATESLRQQARRMAQVARASQALNASLSVEEIARVLTEEARAVVGAHQAVTSLTVSGEGAQAINAVSLSDKYAAWRGCEAQPTGSGICAEVCRSNRPLRLTQEALLQHPAWKDFGEHAQAHPPMRGYLAVPLVGHGGRNLGLVQLSDKCSGDFGVEDEAVLVQLAAIAAVGIENARLYASLREANQRKDEFLATLAHELRNPLAPLGNALGILARDPGAPSAGKLVPIMERQLKHLVRLVDDLLDVSRVTSGKVTLRMEPTTVREVVDLALETSTPLIRSARHTLRVDLPQEELPLAGDKTRLAQILTNLLNNAAKYTPEGGRIELRAACQDGQALVHISDNGLGIPADMLPRVFEMFTQVPGSLERSQGGLGLGLALVAKLAQMHGGEVWAQSEGLGKGSTFTLRLPLAQAQERPAPLPCAPAEDTPAPRMRVMVVDDNVDAADSLAMLLELAGHDTVVAHSGQGAMDLARSRPPEVVFLDIGLPGMNGYEVAKAMRGEPTLARAALIALTGWASEDDRKMAHDSGFDFHLSKPADSDRLQELLRHLQGRPAAAGGFGAARGAGAAAG